jgi:hypothetical protein
LSHCPSRIKPIKLSVGFTESKGVHFNELILAFQGGNPFEINPAIPTDITDASRLIAQNCAEIGAIACPPS